MKIIEAIRALYEHSSDRIIYTDTNFQVLWRNNDVMPEHLFPDRMMLSRKIRVSFPLMESTVCRYKGDNFEMTLKITPMFKKDELQGYMFHGMTEHEVDRIAMQSVLKDRIRKDLEAVRYEAGSIIAMLETEKRSWSKTENYDYTEFDFRSREKVLKIMGATANYEEISRYLGDNVSSETKFMSVVLDDLLKRISCRAEKLGYIFESDIQSMVYAEMNVERFEAVVANIVVNAYMYNSKPEKICKVELKSDGNEIQLIVTDNGNGIPEEKLNKLKNPLEYFTNDDLNESLGLSVAMLYCKRFDGKFNIESKVDQYTKVTLSFKDLGYKVPREFRQYFPPLTFTLDNTGCILGKCFGYYNDDYHKY